MAKCIVYWEFFQQDSFCENSFFPPLLINQFCSGGARVKARYIAKRPTWIFNYWSEPYNDGYCTLMGSVSMRKIETCHSPRGQTCLVNQLPLRLWRWWVTSGVTSFHKHLGLIYGHWLGIDGWMYGWLAVVQCWSIAVGQFYELHISCVDINPQ